MMKVGKFQLGLGLFMVPLLSLHSAESFADDIRLECPGGASAPGVGALAEARGVSKVYAAAVNPAGMQFNGNWVRVSSRIPAGSELTCLFTGFQNAPVLYQRNIAAGYDNCSVAGTRVSCRSSANPSKSLSVECPSTADVGANSPTPFERGETVAGLPFQSASFNRTRNLISCTYRATDSSGNNLLDRKNYLRLPVPDGYTCRAALDGAASVPESAVFYAVECSNSASD